MLVFLKSVSNSTFIFFWWKWPTFDVLQDLSHNSKMIAATFQQSNFEKGCKISIKQQCHADPSVMASAHSCMSYSCQRGLKLSASKWDTQTNVHDLWFDFLNSVVSFHLQILLILYELLIVLIWDSMQSLSGRWILLWIKRQNSLFRE